jgi:Holliday junction DNA helicase RuvB
LDDIIGQEEVKKRLSISVGAAKKRDEQLPHMLFNGPPGLGKTTLAIAVANSREVPVTVANAGNIRSVANITPYLVRLQKDSVLFIDEIHRLPMVVEEFLYPVLEDFRMDIGGDKTVSMTLPPFTLIGATTLGGQLSRPFYDRFTFHYDLELYDASDLVEILKTNTSKVGLTADNSALESLASRCRGTPRRANNYLLWLRDVADNKGESHISTQTVEVAMDMMGIDEQGITDSDRKYLDVLKRSERPMGINTLVSAVGIDRDTIENTIEPYLIRLGMVEKTPKGRMAT